MKKINGFIIGVDKAIGKDECYMIFSDNRVVRIKNIGKDKNERPTIKKNL